MRPLPKCSGPNRPLSLQQLPAERLPPQDTPPRRIARRIAADWQAKYGQTIGLLETFVERDRFAGTCYRAANWQPLGPTQGRSRQDRHGTLRVPVKEVYVYALRSDFRKALGVP